MTDAAFDLWGGKPARRLSLRDLAVSLDGGNFHALVEALFARRGEFIDLDAR